MPVLDELISAIRAATIKVIDLTSRLDEATPVIRLPEPFGNTKSFALHEISRYDERGPGWYWNDITTGEHTGTHFDAPVHWATGRDGEDISQVPVTRLIAPAVVLDFSAEAAGQPGLPARGRGCQEVGGGARRAARRWLAALPDGLGREVGQSGGVPERERDRPAHAGNLGPVRAVAGERDDAARAGRGDRRHGRRRRALVRPAVPLPRLAARRREVRPHPAAEPGQAAGYRRCRHRGPAADRRRNPAARAGPSPWSSAPDAGRRGGTGHRGGAGWLRDAGHRGRGGGADEAGHRHRVRRGRQRQLQDHQRADRPRRPLRGGAAPVRRRGHGRRLGAAGRQAGRPLAAPGPGADQRDDRDHRGGEEPHPADRARRRRGLGRGQVQLPDRCGIAGHGRRRGRLPAALPLLRRRRDRPRLPDGGGRAAHRGPGAAARRAGRVVHDARRRPGRRAAARRRAGRGGRRAGRRAGQGQPPGVHRRAGSADRRRPRGPGAPCRPLRRPARHLGRGQGPVPGQPVGPGRERRLRVPAGRRADPRRRPRRRLGLRTEHVDAAARHPDRPGGDRGPGGRRPGGSRRAPARRAGRDRRRGAHRTGGPPAPWTGHRAQAGPATGRPR